MSKFPPLILVILPDMSFFNVLNTRLEDELLNSALLLRNFRLCSNSAAAFIRIYCCTDIDWLPVGS